MSKYTPISNRLDARATSPRHYRQWTAQEDRRLRLAWETAEALSEVARVVGRTELAVYWRAKQIGLRRGCPQGHEPLRVAAKRAGYSPESLRRILKWAGVKPRAVMARPDLRGAWQFHTVDSFDVDEAVARWMRAESVDEAARRHGTVGSALRSWLIAAGEKPPRARRHRWYLDVDVIDRVVQARRANMKATASVREHARRVGLSRVTLANRLRAAGVLGEKRPGVEVRLPFDVVDRALGRAA